MVASVSIPSMPEVAPRPSYYIRAPVTFRLRSCVGTVTTWHTACSPAAPPVRATRSAARSRRGGATRRHHPGAAGAHLTPSGEATWSVLRVRRNGVGGRLVGDERLMNARGFLQADLQLARQVPGRDLAVVVV